VGEPGAADGQDKGRPEKYQEARAGRDAYVAARDITINFHFDAPGTPGVVSAGHLAARPVVTPELLLDDPRPLRDWSPRRLGVHPAIMGRSAPGREFVLPSYVLRPHDSRLRATLKEAAAGKETMLVAIRGQSCAGKTRTAYEGARACLPDWNVLCPASADGLLATLTARPIGSRTILWLAESQDFLYGPSGERVAELLCRRLDDPGPTIIILALWREYYRELSAAPVPGSLDAHPRARTLLAQASRIDVPPEFDDDDLGAMRRQARTDPSLAAADRTGSRAVTQALAAGLDLVDHYRHPSGPHGHFGQAVITAAMDAQRLGVVGPLPLPLLEAAALGYLTEDQRAAGDPGTWFAGALAYACTQLKGVTAALHAAARPSGIGSQPGKVRLADYLAYHGRETRGLVCPPESFWEACSEHLEASHDLAAAARAARVRWRYRHAALLYQRAADVGDPHATEALARIRHSVQRHGPGHATVEVTPATLAGLHRVRALAAAGDHANAEQLARQLTSAGDALAMLTLAQIQASQGNLLQAGQLLWEAGDSVSLTFNAKWKDGLTARDIEPLARQAADAGDPSILVILAQQLDSAGDHAGAERLARQAADAGIAVALRELAQQRRGRAWQQMLRYGLEPDGSVSDPWF
jgi:hypothetical protein